MPLKFANNTPIKILYNYFCMAYPIFMDEYFILMLYALYVENVVKNLKTT